VILKYFEFDFMTISRTENQVFVQPEKGEVFFLLIIQDGLRK